MEKKIDALLKRFDVQAMHNDNFRKELLLLFSVSGSSLDEDVLKEAFNAGRTVENYKGVWVDDLDIDNYTSAKYENFDKWYENCL